MSISTLFLVVAVILFVIQAIGVPTGRISAGWFGLALFAGSFLV